MDSALKARGYRFTSRGWPDRLCWKRSADGSLRVACVEMKSHGTGLSDVQLLVHSILALVGLPTYVVEREADLDLLDSRAFSIPGMCPGISSRLKKYTDELAKQARGLVQAQRENRRHILARAQRQLEDYAWVLDGRFHQLQQLVESELRRLEELKKMFAPPRKTGRSAVR